MGLIDVINGLTKQSYTVGGPASKPLPVELTLKLDPDFKKTIIKTALIFSAGVAIGVGTGVAVSGMRRRRQ